jgi:hypothetical protein
VINGSDDRYIFNAYAERPQVVQAPDGSPLTFFLGMGRTSYMDSASWAQPFCRQAGQANCGAMHPPPPSAVQYRLGDVCLATNSSSFPCPGGWANSCPAFLAPCASPEAVWLEHPDGSLESAVHAGNCLNFDCNACTPGTLAKVTLCANAGALAFDAAAGSLSSKSCPGACVNDGRQASPAHAPCKAGEQYLPHGQATLQQCGSEGTTGWVRVPVAVEAAPPHQSKRWHYHWDETHARGGPVVV